MREIQQFPLHGIAVTRGRRSINTRAVESLSESIKVVGLRTPITVRLVDNYVDTDGVVVDGQPVLVTGAHRLAAAKLLGWDKIDCYIFEGESEVDAELWEIDENLCRHELTATEVAEHIAKRKELWEARKAQETGGTSCPSSLSDGRQAGPQHQDGFAAETEKVTGASKRDVNRAAKRGNEVCQEARDLIRGTKLDTGKTLDNLMKMEPASQVEWAQEHLEAMAEKERMDALREESKQREIEAKELREAAHIECMNLLCDMMSGRQWAQLIDLVERSGGSIKSAQLRRWQSP